MANKARAEKKPAFISGGVQQKLDQADRMLRVLSAFLPDDDERAVRLMKCRADAETSVAEVAAALDEEITRSNRLPKETYDGADREALRAEILNAWQEAWPQDTVIQIVFHMKAFDRSVKWTWHDADSAWHKSDNSVLAVTVVIKTSDAQAATFPAYVNVDHLSDKSSIGVQTKGSAYVSRKLLIENL